MAKYELSIKASYLPNWGLWEAVREILQNARDSEVQFGADMSIAFAKRKRDGSEVGALVIANKGVTLPKEALLLGHTTKDGDSRLIGKFGEGFKFACLALLRLGVEIKIRNGSEVWMPSIERSEKYNADVLTFNVTTGHKDENRIQFEIVGIDKADWDDISRKLLFIGEYPDNIQVRAGKILTSPRFRGEIYVKGMFVTKTGFVFGYDISEADLDRDRRMISDLQDCTSNMLSEAVNDGNLASQVYELLLNNGTEVQNMSSWRLTSVGREALAKEFTSQNPGVIPVDSIEQLQELESFGKKAKEVSWTLRNILEEALGKAGDTIKELRRSEAKRYDLGELTAEERDTLRFVVATVGRACSKLGETPTKLEEVFVVDFNKPELIGTFDPNTGHVRLSRKVLNNRAKTLYTFVHEVAHAHGADGVRGHEGSIGSLMEEILNELL